MTGRRSPQRPKLLQDLKTGAPASQTDVQQDGADALGIAVDIGNGRVGLFKTFHMEQTLEDLTKDGQIQRGVVNDQKRISAHEHPPLADVSW